MIKDLFKDVVKYLLLYSVPAVVSFFSIPVVTCYFVLKITEIMS